nr:hypothetical protein [uncultured Draconibacterium sp.]
MRIFVLILSIVLVSNLKAQDSTYFYKQAYEVIDSMVTGNTPLDFKKAVFTVENAYFDNNLSCEKFNNEIQSLVKVIQVVKDSNPINYSGTDKDFVVTNASVFQVMTDSIVILLDSTNCVLSLPFRYDFEDMWGQEDWSGMFVSKLLATRKGNCHSLPYLYKILTQEFNITSYLAFAPNHIYIKLHSKTSGWYNTELTSGTFPVDAWIMASGYVHLDAIRNGLYMDTLSLKQSVAYCFLDLAHGYQNRFGKSDPDFVIKCCNKVLEHHPVNVNAMLTRAEAQKYFIDSKLEEQGLSNPQELFSDKSIENGYAEMEQTYVRLYKLGYRRMPEEMYMEWMGLLNSDPEKYMNQKVINKSKIQ